jgi:hypothetical protein
MGDFFQPLHVEHLQALCPQVIPHQQSMPHNALSSFPHIQTCAESTVRSLEGKSIRP